MRMHWHFQTISGKDSLWLHSSLSCGHGANIHITGRVAQNMAGCSICFWSGEEVGCLKRISYGQLYMCMICSGMWNGLCLLLPEIPLFLLSTHHRDEDTLLVACLSCWVLIGNKTASFDVVLII